MAIYRLIANGSFGPAEVKAMTAAYEAALLDLGLVIGRDVSSWPFSTVPNNLIKVPRWRRRHP